MVLKINTVFECFGFFKGVKYISFKSLGFLLRIFFNLIGRKSKNIATFLKNISGITDSMVEKYIYKKYYYVYQKYTKNNKIGEIPTEKIIWTAWLQGKSQMPYAVNKCVQSMINNSGDYKVIVITLDNLEDYLNVDAEIIDLLHNHKISAAHFTDYIRMKLLFTYGGVWMDATQFLIKPLPSEIWNYDLLVWNTVFDVTNRNVYASIPFVEKFNNGFLVGRMGSSFYEFATEITEKLLFDPILKIDYFTNFKSIFVAIKYIPSFKYQWMQMPIFNPYGLLTRQFWNISITKRLKEYIMLPENYFFNIVYKKEWVEENDDNSLSIEEYILKEFEK